MIPVTSQVMIAGVFKLDAFPSPGVSISLHHNLVCDRNNGYQYLVVWYDVLDCDSGLLQCVFDVIVRRTGLWFIK